MILLLNLLYQSGKNVPLPLVAAYYINGSFSWVEFTQLLRAGLGSMVGLNPYCSHPVETIKLNAHNNQRQALNSAQTKFTGLISSF